MDEQKVAALLGKHKLSRFLSVDNGYEANCQLCGKKTWVGFNGLQYSLLAKTCPSATSSVNGR